MYFITKRKEKRGMYKTIYLYTSVFLELSFGSLSRNKKRETNKQPHIIAYFEVFFFFINFWVGLWFPALNLYIRSTTMFMGLKSYLQCCCLYQKSPITLYFYIVECKCIHFVIFFIRNKINRIQALLCWENLTKID